MENESLILSFPGVSAADGNVYAGTLSNDLLRIDPSLKVERSRTNPDTQDFGATLILVLGTASVQAVVRGLTSWLVRNSGARIDITTSTGKVVAKNIDSRDASRIAEALSPHP
jgi:hypothetical protein